MKTIPSLQYMTHGLVEEQETLGKTKRTKKMKTMIATTDAYTEDSNLGSNLKADARRAMIGSCRIASIEMIIIIAA